MKSYDIEIINNKARHNLIDPNTIRWRCDRLDDTVVLRCLGTPGQTKVNGDRQRETPHEICCLAAEKNHYY